MLTKSVDFSRNSQGHLFQGSPRGSDHGSPSPKRLGDYTIELPSLQCVNFNPVETRTFKQKDYSPSPHRINSRYVRNQAKHTASTMAQSQQFTTGVLARLSVKDVVNSFMISEDDGTLEGYMCKRSFNNLDKP